jgi:TetR/AcrR family transcriptional regulator, repressor for uid operon
VPKLKPATQIARREHILDAAEQCFARQGFHRTTMQDICREAHISAGALYVYFASKEALIAGIVERDRQKLSAQFSGLANSPDLMQALAALGQHYFIDEPKYKRILHIEIGAESTRNPEVGSAFQTTDQYCLDRFTELFERAKAEGKIAPILDIPDITRFMSVIGDGMFWRRAVDPNFDARAALTTVIGILTGLLNPTPVSVPTRATSTLVKADT